MPRLKSQIATTGRRGFWAVAGMFSVVQLGGTLPVPLYVLWQGPFGFGNATLTLIFAIYAIGTLLSLLLLAPLSDQLGRRPALIAALGVGAVSTGLFLAADSVALLLAARFVSGIAAGITTATATAALRELEPGSRARRASLTATAANMGGLGLGPLLAGIVVEYGSDPLKLVFWIYLGLLVLALLGVLSSSETVARPERLVLRPRGLSLPEGARAEFAIAAGVVFCAFTVLGLFSSLVPSFLASSLHEQNHAIAGAIVAAIFLTATATQLVLFRVSPTDALSAGLLVLLVGLALIELGLWTGSLGVFLGGTVVSGLAIGLSFMGSVATVNRIAAPEQRGRCDGRVLRQRVHGPQHSYDRRRRSERLDRDQRRDPVRRDRDRGPGQRCARCDPPRPGDLAYARTRAGDMNDHPMRDFSDDSPLRLVELAARGRLPHPLAACAPRRLRRREYAKDRPLRRRQAIVPR